MKTVNNLVACKPTTRDFKPEMKTESGFGTLEQTTELVQLEVWLDSEEGYKADDVVFVSGAVLDRSEWGKNKFKLNGTDIILVPSSQIIIWVDDRVQKSSELKMEK